MPLVNRWADSSVDRMAETCSFPSSFCLMLICFITSLHVEKFLICETFMKFIYSWLVNCRFYCITFMMVIIFQIANRVVSFSYTVDSSVDRWVVGDVGRFSFLVSLMRLSIDRCRDCSVDRWCIPLPRGMMYKFVFLIKNGYVLCSSFFFIIFIILLHMHVVSGVCFH